MSNGKASTIVFEEGNGVRGRDNVNCVIHLELEEPEQNAKKDIDLKELPPGQVPNESGPNEDSNTPPRRQNGFNRKVEYVDHQVKGFLKSHWTLFKRIIYLVLACLSTAYVIAAAVLDFQRAIAVIVVAILVLCYVIYRLIKYKFGEVIASTALTYKQQKCDPFIGQRRNLIKWVIYVAFVIFIIIMLAATGVFHSIVKEPNRIRSLFGLVCMLIFSFIVSKYPSRIKWRTVFWGLWLQMFLGILILRTKPGHDAFNWLGSEVESFLSYTNAGAVFVFGPAPLEVHQFLLVVLPVIIFTSAVFALLYYWQVMQVLIEALAHVMHVTMGTSGAESFATASNIFVGMTVAPLAIKPYLNDMTRSEMHALIVGGFATIAGSVLAIFISFKISAAHLLAASFMSAPAALVTAKMFLPETKKPKTAKSANIETSKAEESNALEAMYVGAIDGLKICAYIIGNILAIISVLAFINSALAWFGGLINIENLSFQMICRYVLYPLAWLLGVDGRDCLIVAELIGIKLFLNEIVAYQTLGVYVAKGEITRSTQVIATYALCGFANLGSIGVMMGGLIPLVPNRKAEISRLCVRAFFAALVALLMTACIAGFLYDESQIYNPLSNGNNIPPTVNATLGTIAANTTDAAATVAETTTMGLTTMVT